ncbi:MAG: peptidoglycan DD-metalloendopeptidase family protein [Ramlibacter sp.]
MGLWAVLMGAVVALTVYFVPREPVVTTIPEPPAATPPPPRSKPASAPTAPVARPSPADVPVAPPLPRHDTTESSPSGGTANPPPLLIPVEGVAARDLRDTFGDSRGDTRGHEAIDIHAALGTPVLAVDEGRIAKLFQSKPGGITIYQFNKDGTLAYYYAHLDRYAPGLAEGQQVRRGAVIGYVGTTGNAAPDAPHLHFAVFRLGPEKKWWKGEPVNPFGYLGGQAR